MDIMVTISEITNGFSNHGQGMQFLKEGNCYNLPSKMPLFFKKKKQKPHGSLVLICVANIIFMHIMRN